MKNKPDGLQLFIIITTALNGLAAYNTLEEKTLDLLTELKGMGNNIDEGLERCMNNAGLYEKLLKKVPQNIEKLEVLAYFEAGDYETALMNAHTIKGVAGNLSLTPLFSAYSDIVNLLRDKKPEEAKKTLIDILPLQEQILSCIKKYS